MNIWILQTGEPLHIDEGKPRAMRAMNLSNKLVEAGHNVFYGVPHLIINKNHIEVMALKNIL